MAKAIGPGPAGLKFWKQPADMPDAVVEAFAVGTASGVGTAAADTTAAMVGTASGAGTAAAVGKEFAGTENAWKSTDKSANFTLSNSDRTATATSATGAGIRSTTRWLNGAAGKFYAEIVATTTPSSLQLGLMDVTVNRVLGTANSFYVDTNNGSKWVAEVLTGTNLGAFAAGDILCIAWDSGAERVWFRKNNGNWNANAAANPATGANGLDVSFAAANDYALWCGAFASAAAATVCTDIANFTFTMPSGFTSWMGEAGVAVTSGVGTANGVGTAAASSAGIDASVGTANGVGTAAASSAGIDASVGTANAAGTAAATAGATTTSNAWKSTDKTANFALSNSDQTATATNSVGAGVRSTTRWLNGAAGKFYAELVATTTPASLELGVQDTTAHLTVGTDKGFHVSTGSGEKYVADVVTGTGLGAFAAGDVLCVAWDSGAERVWFRKNNGTWNANAAANPATGANGLDVSFAAANDYALCARAFTSGAASTIRTEFAQFTFASPSGFTSWMGEAATGVTSGDGAASGIGAATATAIALKAATATAAGIGAAAGVGVETAAAAGSAVGTGTATATGRSTYAGVGNASGTGAALATGAETAASTATAAGVGAATATAQATDAGIGNAAATGSAAGISDTTATIAAVGTSSGAGAGAGVGAQTTAAVGSAAGIGAATLPGVAFAIADGTAVGIGVVNAVGASVAEGIGTAAGAGATTATGIAFVIAIADGTAAGIGAASANGLSVVGVTVDTTLYTADNATYPTSDGYIPAVAAGVGVASGEGTATAIGTGITEIVGNAAGLATATGIPEGITVAAAVGTAAGVGAATATGSSDAVEPPIVIGGGGGFIPRPRLFPVEGYGFGILPQLEGEAHGVVVVVGAGAGTLPRLRGEATGAVGVAGRSAAQLVVHATAVGDRGQVGAAVAVLKGLSVASKGVVGTRGAGVAILKIKATAAGRHDDDEAAVMTFLLAA